MLDITAILPTYYWTYDKISSHQGWGYDDDVWIADEVDRATVSETSIEFDAPEIWEFDIKRVVFKCNQEGTWAWRGEGSTYEGVRSETVTHVLLTGIWKEPDDRGAFVLVIPKLIQLGHSE